MPWKVVHMSEQRWAFCHAIKILRRPVAQTARAFGVSRKTAYKWLKRYDQTRTADAVDVAELSDRRRRPAHSPSRTDDLWEKRILAVRDADGYGPRKIHAILRREHPGQTPPCLRTVANVLRRCGRVVKPEPVACQRFERAEPNQLWQIDHKGPVEVARRKLLPLTVIDNHSRYALAFEPLIDRTMHRSWQVLWNVFGEAGLPDAILCDNAFGTMGIDKPVGLSWFDAQCVKLSIKPLHGRPYHPQTQGKVEAFHASAVREFIFRHARRDDQETFGADCHVWRQRYNTYRPHEALGDEVPLSRWRPSTRLRPAAMPATVEYEPGAVLRKVCLEGLVRWQGRRILVGRGIGGEMVRFEEDATELRVFYGWKQVRCLQTSLLSKDRVL